MTTTYLPLLIGLALGIPIGAVLTAMLWMWCDKHNGLHTSKIPDVPEWVSKTTTYYKQPEESETDETD